MTNKRRIVIIVILVVIIPGGLRLSGVFNGNRKVRAARQTVSSLEAKGDLKEGDIIFQTSLSRQSEAIALATRSAYTHCGIIYKEGNEFVVFEAVQPVRFTSLDKWIARGKDGHYAIKRLKNADAVLTQSAVRKMTEVGHAFEGKSYDILFDWSDDKIYCSELVWKVYDRAVGVQVGHLQTLRDFDLTDGRVKTKLKERYGDKLPLDESVISPVSIFKSELLRTVTSNY